MIKSFWTTRYNNSLSRLMMIAWKRQISVLTFLADFDDLFTKVLSSCLKKSIPVEHLSFLLYLLADVFKKTSVFENAWEVLDEGWSGFSWPLISDFLFVLLVKDAPHHDLCFAFEEWVIDFPKDSGSNMLEDEVIFISQYNCGITIQRDELLVFS